MKYFIKFALALLILPILLFIDTVKSGNKAIKKLLLLLAILIFIVPTWISGYTNLFQATNIVLYEFGIRDKLTHVHVSGTSMLPTIRDGETVTLNNPKKFKVDRGDIVSFQNIETGGVHYIKRVVGLAGEKIAIVNGQVTINGQALKEDYIYLKSPTYGNTYILDCELLDIPKGTVAVFGDNRLASTDSRVLGFVNLDNIDGVIKTGISTQFTPSIQSGAGHDIQIDNNKFIELLNNTRKKNNSPQMQSQTLLNQIAEERANKIASDINNWKENSIPLEDILDKSGYSYLLAREMVTFGYLNEEQLLEQISDSPLYKYDFLSGQYFELGIGTSLAQKGECSFPVINIILGWPTNPQYSQDTIDIWRQDIEILTRIASAMKELQYKPGINRVQAENLIDEITSLLQIANEFSVRLESSDLFSQADYNSLENYFEKSAEIREQIIVFHDINTKNVTDAETLSLLQQTLIEPKEIE